MGWILLPSIPMKKQLASALVLAVLLLPACTPTEPAPVDGGSEASEQTIDLTDTSSSEAATEQSSDAASSAPAQAASSKPAVTAPATGSRTVLMTVTNFKFEPAQITVKKGEKIKLQVTAIEGTHGLAIPDLGVNVSVAPGQTVTIDIPTMKTGTFSFFCSIPCGSGHRDMRGMIVIE